MIGQFDGDTGRGRDAGNGRGPSRGGRTDPNGASTMNVFANGVLLTRIVDTPGNGTEPGLAFTVSASGGVTP